MCTSTGVPIIVGGDCIQTNKYIKKNNNLGNMAKTLFDIFKLSPCNIVETLAGCCQCVGENDYYRNVRRRQFFPHTLIVSECRGHRRSIPVSSSAWLSRKCHATELVSDAAKLRGNVIATLGSVIFNNSTTCARCKPGFVDGSLMWWGRSAEVGPLSRPCRRRCWRVKDVHIVTWNLEGFGRTICKGWFSNVMSQVLQ